LPLGGELPGGLLWIGTGAFMVIYFGLCHLVPVGGVIIKEFENSTQYGIL